MFNFPNEPGEPVIWDVMPLKSKCSNPFQGKWKNWHIKTLQPTRGDSGFSEALGSKKLGVYNLPGCMPRPAEFPVKSANLQTRQGIGNPTTCPSVDTQANLELPVNNSSIVETGINQFSILSGQNVKFMSQNSFTRSK